MSIPFIQFLRPNGERKAVEIDMPDPIEEKARVLLKAGCRFEIEELTTGEINMECMVGEICVAGEVCPNGPAVPEAVQRMVLDAYERLDR